MKPKVAVLTLHWSNNYGAVYQAYALQKFLSLHGYEPCILDYRMEAVCLSRILRHPILSVQKILQKNLLNIDFLVKRLKLRKSSSCHTSNHAIFNNFRDKYLRVSQHEYLYADLRSSVEEFDAFIVGSDQVWAADFVFTSDAYLLGFVDRDRYSGKLISYAPSFGKSKLEPYLHKKFSGCVSQFDAISCRESNGCEIVHTLVGRSAVKVVDPTLLISNYSEISSYEVVPRNNYLLVYFLSQDKTLAEWFFSVVEHLSREKGLEVVVVAPEGVDDRWMPNLICPSPEELLGLIEKCSFMITNSFHGTVFSLIKQVQFLTLARDCFSDKQNIRLIELLDAVGLSHRFMLAFLDENMADKAANENIDFEDVYIRLREVISGSQRFLLDALSSASN
ncbi:polysaccharide pyruvyl transferase family protein [Neptuniibacter sp. CAU 1671]|uniref:polysaccharide pyruvyl transferase family protein n=1 Tax=Neptuniibacter sp. CAU 1671 TaxID=3032593 RepID=UPI0023DA2020|nr:polysaccharide pyruvyl transferase family protein [Neptuniibacter sp. CAU 1671]MDF2181409.1 polysaccharide pyruvyl transferase family protein [Neptuniibacter sp. CAU 1671]